MWTDAECSIVHFDDLWDHQHSSRTIIGMSGDVCNMPSLHMKGSAEFHNMSTCDDSVMENEGYNYHTLNEEEEGGHRALE